MKNPFLLLLITAFLSGCNSLPPANLLPEGRSLRIVTYNINYGGNNPENVADYLKTSGADIIYLQETHKKWEDYLKKHLSKEYPYSSFHASGGAGGIAFMSKYPLKNIRAIGAKAGWFPALIADVDTPIGNTQVLNVHPRPPLNDRGSVSIPAYVQSPYIHRRKLYSFLQEADLSRPMIIAGDFNEGDSRKGIKWLVQNGFTDALPLYDKHSKTWGWQVMPYMSISNRYDHIVFSKHFYCTGARVTYIDANDHYPVIAAFIKKQ